MTEEPERIIHNGQILHDVPGVHTTTAQTVIPSAKPGSSSIPDIDPDELAALLAATISASILESPVPSPMEIVNRLLQLKTTRGHKALFTRFDMAQLFAIWSNKLEAKGFRR